MASLSEETKAIIERLKSEGDLIRNTGTNSIKSMNIKLEKFDGLFTSINSNIKMQTEMMQAQLGLQQEAVERGRTSEQFDELGGQAQKPTLEPESKANDAAAKAETDKKIDNIADSIASGFSLKNFALGAAGLFVGYNLLKGFVDEKTNGGWTAFETNLGSMAKGLGGIDFSTLPTTFSNLQASLDGIGESLASLKTSLETITNIGWLDIAKTVLMSIGALQAYNLTMRTALALMNRNRPGGGTPGRRGFFRRLLAGGVTGEVLRRIFSGDPDLDAEVRARAGATNPANRSNPVDNMTADERARLRASDTNLRTNFRPDGADFVPDKPVAPAPNLRVTQIGPDNFRYQDMDANGKYIRNVDAQSRLQAAGFGKDGLPNVDTSPRVPPSAYNGLRNQGARQGDAGLSTARKNAGQLILAEKRGLIARMARNKIGKVILMGVPIVGAVASLGYAIWNFAKGDFTSAALQVASIPLPTVSGTAIDIGSVATEIFFAVTNESFNPDNEGHVEIMEGIGEELHQAYEDWMSDKERQARDTFDMLPEDQRAAITAEQEYIAGGGRPGGMREALDGNFASQSLGQNYYTGADVRLSDSPYFRGNYVRNSAGNLMFTDRNGRAYVQGQNERPNLTTIEDGAGSGYGQLITIQPTTIAPQSFNITEGNKSVAMTNVSGGGGGGGGVMREIGLTNGLVT